MSATTDVLHPAAETRDALPGDVHVTGRRVIATFIDGIVFAAAYVLMAALLGTIKVVPLGYDSSHELLGYEWRAAMPMWASALYGVLVFAYYVALEGYLAQTIGKMVTGIKVVHESTGDLPGPGAALIRTVVRVIDSLAGYIVAFVAVMFSGERQRLGDRAAHTLVVRA